MQYSGMKNQNEEKIKFRNLFVSLMRNIRMMFAKEKKLRNRITNTLLLIVLSKLIRNICKKGYGGTSTLDALSFYRRRPDVDTEIVEFDDWMTSKPWSRDAVENQISFQIDFKDWQQTLTKQEKTILSHLMQGYKAKDIADILQLTYQTVRTIIIKLKQLFLDYFRLEEFAYP